MSDPIHRLSGLAESCVFAKQSPGPLHCGPDFSGRRFFRSYASNLPSSLAMDHSSALGYSPRLPVSVCGTGCIYLKLRDFSWKYAWDYYSLSLAGSGYFQVSAQRTDLPAHFNAYLPSTPYSVTGRVLRAFVLPSQYIQVPEY